MGDSGLTVYVGIAAWGVIVVALIMAVVAWRIPKRTVRAGVGLGLMVLGLLSAVVLSFVATVLAAGLGVAVFILGVRTVPADGKAEGRVP